MLRAILISLIDHHAFEVNYVITLKNNLELVNNYDFFVYKHLLINLHVDTITNNLCMIY